MEIANQKFILDACCGGRMFWFDKHHPNVLYVDKFIKPNGHTSRRKNHCVIPDIQCSFTSLPFESESFKLVVFDPPHLITTKPSKLEIAKEYGYFLKNEWEHEIKAGFDECWRVLKKDGVLVFKWNEISISHKKVLEVIGREPLFGHPPPSRVKTHWFLFMKLEEDLCGSG